MRRDGQGWALAFCLGVCLQAGALPVYEEKTAQALGHLTVVNTAEADPQMVAELGEICEVAATVYEQDLKLTPPADLRLYVSRCKNWHCSTVTDRRSRVYVDYTPPERGQYQICSDYDGAQSGPVHILCRAVAELFNPHRIPGLEQLLASHYAVPAVLDQLGAKAWHRPYNIEARDGEGRMRAYTDSPDLVNHPRWAAAVALGKAVDKLKPEAFAKTLAAVKGQGRPALAMLRKLLVAQVPELDAAFADYDQAIDLPQEKDGSVVLSSFENAAQCSLLRHPIGCQLSVSTEWATDGKRCGVFTFAPVSWPRACRYDPDWRYGDWSEFTSFEFDVKNPSDRQVHLVVQAGDDESDGHGMLRCDLTLAPGAVQHGVMSLLDPKRQFPYQGIYFEGRVRLDDMRELKFTLSDEDLKTPTVLWIDNLRLKP